MGLQVRLALRIAGGIALVLAHGACAGASGGDRFVPTADAGVNQVARVNVPVSLDGSQSRDPEGRALTFEWRQDEGTPVVLDDAGAVRPTFTPTTPGTYVFELRVRVTPIDSEVGRVTVIVVDDLSTTPRRPPAAEPRAAGLDHAVFLFSEPVAFAAASGRLIGPRGTSTPVSIVDLASDPSDDPPPGATAGLVEIDLFIGGAPFAALYAPALPGDEDPVSIQFDGGTEAPVRAFGQVGRPFILDGTRSHDDEVIRTWTWTQVDGPLQFTTQAGELTVTPVVAGTYVFELVVTDNAGLTSFARRVTIPVLPANALGAGPPLAAARVLSGATEAPAGDARIWRSRAGHLLEFDDTKSLSFADGAPDARGGALTFQWEQLSGPTARLFGPVDGPMPQFVPLVPGTYVFRLAVTDENGVSDSSEVSVSVGPPDADGPAAALAPISDVSISSTGLASVDVVLDATASDGGSAPSFLWSQVHGVPCVVDPGPVPGTGLVHVDQPGVYEFEVYVIDENGVRSPPARRTFTAAP